MTPPFLGGDVSLAVFLFLFSFFLFLRNQNRMTTLHKHYHKYSNAVWASAAADSLCRTTGDMGKMINLYFFQAMGDEL